MMEASPLEAYGKAPLAEGMPYRYIHGRDPSSASEELCLAMSRYTAGAAAWEDATGMVVSSVQSSSPAWREENMLPMHLWQSESRRGYP